MRSRMTPEYRSRSGGKSGSGLLVSLHDSTGGANLNRSAGSEQPQFMRNASQIIGAGADGTEFSKALCVGSLFSSLQSRLPRAHA
jgi:hypothetical protein